MISIEIPVIHGKYINQVLESIRSQSFQDYETIIVAKSDLVLEPLDHDVRLIRANLGTLSARYVGHMASHGDFSLLLDETRKLSLNCLLKLSESSYDMSVIPERENITGIWSRICDLDRVTTGRNRSLIPSKNTLYVLPRYFRSKLLQDAFEVARSKSANIFDTIVLGELEILFLEALNMSNNIGSVDGCSLTHFGDETFLDTLKKYIKYGKTKKILDGTSYGDSFRLSNFVRRNISIGTALSLAPFFGVKLLGVISGVIASRFS